MIQVGTHKVVFILDLEGNLLGVARNEDGDDSGGHTQGRLHIRPGG